MRQNLSKIAILLVLSLCLPLFAACDISKIVTVGTNGSNEDEEVTESVLDSDLPKGLSVKLNERDNTYTVDDYKGTASEVVIPATHNGFPIVEIGASAFMNNKKLTGIVIPDSVKTIGDSAFKNCVNLKAVYIGEKESALTQVGKQAFFGCRSLESITFVGYEKSWINVELGKDWDKDAGSKTDNETYELIFVDPVIVTEAPTAAPIVEPTEEMTEMTDVESVDVLTETSVVETTPEETDPVETAPAETEPQPAETETKPVETEVPSIVPESTETEKETETETETEIVECAHIVSSWSFYDDGDNSTDLALEAGRCSRCGERVVRNAAFRGVLDKINGKSITPYTNQITGTHAVLNASAIGVTADENARIDILGWIVSNSSMSKMVYKVDSSDWMPIHKNIGHRADVASLAPQWGFNGDYAYGYNHAIIDLSDYAGKMVAVTIGFIADDASAGSNDIYIPLIQLCDLAVPKDYISLKEDFYWNAKELASFEVITSNEGRGKATLSSDGSYVTISKTSDSSEAYSLIYKDGIDGTGRYVAIKYRLPEGVTNSIEFFSSTVNADATSEDHIGRFECVADGEWHVFIADAAAFNLSNYKCDANGKYVMRYLRMDYIYGKDVNSIDIAYVAVYDDLAEAVRADKSVDSVDFYASNIKVEKYDPSTGEQITPEDPEIEYPGEVFLDAKMISKLTTNATSSVANVTVSEDGSFIRYERNGTQSYDLNVILLTGNQNVTGQYVVIKYRTDHMASGEFWANTVENSHSTGKANFSMKYVTDGEWHIAVIDLSEKIKSYVKANEKGEYVIQWSRIDHLNITASEGYFDIGFVAFCDDIGDLREYIDPEICEHNTTKFNGNYFAQNGYELWAESVCLACGANEEAKPVGMVAHVSTVEGDGSFSVNRDGGINYATTLDASELGMTFNSKVLRIGFWSVTEGYHDYAVYRIIDENGEVITDWTRLPKLYIPDDADAIVTAANRYINALDINMARRGETRDMAVDLSHCVGRSVTVEFALDVNDAPEGMYVKLCEVVNIFVTENEFESETETETDVETEAPPEAVECDHEGTSLFPTDNVFIYAKTCDYCREVLSYVYGNQEGLVMFDPTVIYESATVSAPVEKHLANSNGLNYVRFMLSEDISKENYIYLLNGSSEPIENVGRYFAVMYRASSGVTSSIDTFISNNSQLTAQHNRVMNFKRDFEWHVAIVDLSSSSVLDVSQAIQTIRLDIFNGAMAAGEYVDIAAAGFFSSEDQASYFFENEYFGGEVTPAFTFNIDAVYTEGTKVAQSARSENEPLIYDLADAYLSTPKSLNIGGWCVTNGGVAEYMYRVTDVESGNVSELSTCFVGANVPESNGIYMVGQSMGYDSECGMGASFQSRKVINLEGYEDKTVNVELVILTNNGQYATVAYLNNIYVPA